MFGTSGIRGPVGETVTADLAVSLAHALAPGVDRVVLARDARESGRALSRALAGGLLECGVDVIDGGVCATPSLARAVAPQDADAGVMVTASHNPPPDNGIKLWRPDGQAFTPTMLEPIEDRLAGEQRSHAAWDDHGEYRRWDGATDAHVDALVAAGRQWGGEGDDGDRTPVTPLADLPVAVDVGNGTGAATAEALSALGASVTTLNAQPDGHFPGRPSEPTAEHCADLRRFVAAGPARLGLAHDGDADRLLAVDENGEFVGGDALLGIFAREMAGPGDRVAVPVDTSQAVADALAELDADVTHTPVGDVHVAAATREPEVVFGGEPSGAWIFPEETRCPDGPLAAVRLATLVRERSLADRVAALPTYPIRRDAMEVADKRAVAEAVAERARERHESVDELDGVRIDLAEGWILIRPSGTEPVVRLTAEARDATTADAYLADARELLEGAIAAQASNGPE